MTDTVIAFTDKQSARTHFIEIRKGISENIRQELDKMLFLNTVGLSAFSDAEAILCYYPIRGEPNVLPLAEHAIRLGKKVAFPISHIKERQLSFHEIKSLSDLTTGAYKIPEPSEMLPEITDFSKALCIVPALAFDVRGVRLGYGGGYYDKFLSTFNGTAIGLAYNDFYVNKLPSEPHDAMVSIIVTENGGYFSCEKK